jgi:hypothetical protein
MEMPEKQKVREAVGASFTSAARHSLLLEPIRLEKRSQKGLPGE